MAASPLARIAQILDDPFGFADAFRDLHLSVDDLPGLTRECRMAGAGT